jgi:predicted membrane protein
MNLSNLVKSFSPLETFLVVVFVLYLIFPVQTPHFLAGTVDSPVGIIAVFTIAVYLYFYVNPIVAVVYIFAAYEMIRRSSNHSNRVTLIQYTPSQAKKDEQMAKMNPRHTEILEVDVVAKMAPIGHSDPIQILSSSYKPISESIGTASTY